MKVAGEFGGDGFEDFALFADDVIDRLVVELDLVKAGAVVEEAAANEAEFFEGGETAINGNEIAGAVFEILMDLLGGGRLGAIDERGENGDARLRDAQACGFEAGAGLFQSAASGLRGRSDVG